MGGTPRPAPYRYGRWHPLEKSYPKRTWTWRKSGVSYVSSAFHSRLHVALESTGTIFQETASLASSPHRGQLTTPRPAPYRYGGGPPPEKILSETNLDLAKNRGWPDKVFDCESGLRTAC